METIATAVNTENHHNNTDNGIAKIKAEFLIKKTDMNQVETESSTGVVEKVDPRDDPRNNKKQRRERGQNKNRKFTHSQDVVKLCSSIANDKECPHGENCKSSHNLEEFLKTKEEDIGEKCVNFDLKGECPYGYRCRYLKAHFKDGKLVKDEEKIKNFEPQIVNKIESPFLAKLRKGGFDFSRSDKVNEALDKERNQKKEEGEKYQIYNTLLDEPLKEKKLIDFRNKTYLAPLTTVGNLPFRRICKEFGVDITCGEMAMASNLLQGQKAEWSLVRKHKSEDLFGIQLAGNRPDYMIKCADLINQELEVDFVDINLGCPIDAVYKNGGGSALMGHTNKLGRMVRGMNTILDCPLTVKFRTGIYHEKKIAHTIIPLFEEWGCSLGTLHGRSRQQRYTKLANWDYIKECHSLTNKMPLFGNGDILSYEDYNQKIQESLVDGIMVGRGALIKPWLFEEIKTQQYKDISSKERLDIIKKFCDYGLEHWGSDTMGVNHTRRFLCEWLSFLHRYIPVGLLQVLPQKINNRPPACFGRDDLETLMLSSKAEDWIKITEMYLGKSPADFAFIPKHKANSYQ
ncbi:FMN-linked oxidoreductase [Neoconidiobolus thromboides FSU 785]|nr:FMN-linked oxidoreductase [Neoconidiobolus thromboides FSU 785]